MVKGIILIPSLSGQADRMTVKDRQLMIPESSITIETRIGCVNQYLAASLTGDFAAAYTKRYQAAQAAGEHLLEPFPLPAEGVIIYACAGWTGDLFKEAIDDLLKLPS